MFDPEAFGAAMGDLVREAVAPLQKEIAQLKEQLANLPKPKDGERGPQGEKGADGSNGKDGIDGVNGKDGSDGERGPQGEKGADGLGLAGAMIDRDGALQITLTNGEVKNLGVVVGKDGTDGISFEAFELEYLPDSHDMQVKVTVAGRTREVRYPAGGIRPAGYWRDGTKAQAGEAWVHDGSLWIAMKATTLKPESRSEDWIIAARKGRDGERGQKGQDGVPVQPIKLQG